MSYVVSIFLPVWAEGDCIGVRLHSCNAVIEFVLSYSYLLYSLLHKLHTTFLMLLVHHLLLLLYLGTTLYQKYHKFVSICIVPSV